MGGSRLFRKAAPFLLTGTGRKVTGKTVGSDYGPFKSRNAPTHREPRSNGAAAKKTVESKTRLSRANKKLALHSTFRIFAQ